MSKMSKELINTLSEIEKLIERFSDTKTYDELFNVITLQLDLLVKNDSIELYIFDDVEQKLKLLYSKSYSEEETMLAEQSVMKNHAGYVYKTGEIILINNQDKENNHFLTDSKTHYHTQSCLFVPIKIEQTIIGTFGLKSNKPNIYNETHVAYLKVFSSLIGKSYKEIQKNNLLEIQNREPKEIYKVYDNTTHHIIHADEDGKIKWVNQHFQNFTGYSLKEVIGKQLHSFLIGAETEAEKRLEITNAIKTKNSCNIITTSYKKDGTLYSILVQIQPVFGEDGSFLHYIALQEVIDNQLLNNKLLADIKKLKESQKQYTNLLQTTNDLITSLDKQGNILFANKSWLNKMKYSIEEVLHKNIFNFIHPDSQEHCMAFFSKLTTENNTYLDVNYTLINKHGEKIDVEGNVICNLENKKLVDFSSFLKDVSEINRKNIKEAFKQKQLLLHNEKLSELNTINFSKYPNFETITEEIIIRIKDCVNAQRFSIWRYNEKSINCEYVLDTINKAQKTSKELFEHDFPNFFHGINSQLSIEAYDAHQNILTRELSEQYLKPLNINSMLIMPIKVENKLCALFCVEQIGDNAAWTEEDISFTKTIANIISNLRASYLIKDLGAKLNQLLSSLNETVWAMTLPDYKLQYISESALELYEIPISNWHTNTNLWFETIHPEDKERIKKESENLFKVGYTNLEYRIVTPTNKIKWIYSNTRIINDEKNTPILMTGISGEITTRKIIENELVNYKTAIDESAIVSVTDMNGNITYVNESFCKISQYTRQELIGKNHNIINSGYHTKDFFKEMWQTIISGKIWKGEIKNKAKDGSCYHVQSVILPFLKDGKPFQYISIRHETTSLKLKEEALNKQKVFYENIMDNIPIDIAVFNEEQKYIYINKTAIANKETRDWLIGKDDFDYAKYKNIPSNFAEIRRASFKKLSDINNKIIWIDNSEKNGTKTYAERGFFKVPNQDIVIGFGIDVTNLKKHEFLLDQSIKEKETLLGEVHHRVKNNLAVIDGMIELKKFREENNYIKEVLTDIQTRVKTVAIVHQKLYQSVLFSKINLGEYVLDLIEYQKKIYNKTNSTECSAHVNIKNIYTDISKAVTLGLIINELLSNSFKYAFVNNYLKISISMEIIENIVLFEYTDSGKGLNNENSEPSKVKSGFGLNLINTLSKQLKAQISYPNVPYFKLVLELPIKTILVE